MRAFKSGERPSTIMGRIAKGYDDEDFDKMGEFFAAQEMHFADQSAGGMAAKGGELHDKYCDKCHADNGTDPEDEAGQLGGQWSTYLKYQLEDVMDGSRDPGKKMVRQVTKMQKKVMPVSRHCLITTPARNKKRYT
jgi:sulfide dehydrogenase cytochrome subunit